MDGYKARVEEIEDAERIALYALSIKNYVAFHRWAARVLVMRECLEVYAEKTLAGGGYEVQ